MKNKGTKSSRRLVLKGGIAASGIAVSNVMPDKWSKPIIDAIILPSHAMTTPSTTTTVVPTTTAAPTTTTTTLEPLQAECEITGPDRLNFTLGLQGFVKVYTISNTGAAQLTFVNAIGAFGGNANGSAALKTPFTTTVLNPGASFNVLLLANSAPTNCNFIGGTFTLTVVFTETSCQFVADVQCSVLS